jgi:hypothetical protein
LCRVRGPGTPVQDRPLEEAGGRTAKRAETLVKDNRIGVRRANPPAFEP